jgi:MinD-like ATPase involved in chromosome partitioning or flagellar assembly
MSSFKAKTVLNKDIRVFKKDINSIEDAFEALKNFVKEKYDLQVPFIIQYEDEEKDLITIGSSEDLNEAYHQAEQLNTVLKLLIVPDNIGVPVYSFTSELDKSQQDGGEEEQDKQDDNKEKKR